MLRTLDINSGFYDKKEIEQLNGVLRLANELAEIGGNVAPVAALKSQLDQALVERAEIIEQQIGLKSSDPDYQETQEYLAARLTGCEAKLRRLFIEVPDALSACQVSEFNDCRDDRLDANRADLDAKDEQIIALLLQVRELVKERLSLAQWRRRLADEYHKISELNRGEPGVYDFSPYQEVYPWKNKRMPLDASQVMVDFAGRVAESVKYGGAPEGDLLTWIKRVV